VHPALALALSYASGSLPFAWLAGKAAGVDLRTQGSGNLGATNVFRVLGWKIGVVVFLADALKGALPVLLLPGRIDSALDATIWAIACGVAAIAGHVRPLFLKFRKGGKGVATAAGVFFALAPVPMLVTFAVFVAVVLATGYVSLGSLLSAVVLPTLLLVTHGPRSPLFIVSVVVATFVFWTHRANIGRLRRGEEHRFGKRGRA
jgi:glycerol-3-phosphate acyltransferase PlsY